jgi:soluble lytic murein transglycosylase
LDLASSIGRGLLALTSVALITSIADAQPVGAPTAAPGQASQPYAQFPQVATAGALSDADRDALSIAISDARRGQGAAAVAAQISDPVARKIALWAAIDADGEQLSFFQLDQARRDLAGWPRETRRQTATEKAIETSGLDPARIIAWFQGAEPQSPQGAMALAAAYEQTGARQSAQDLIRRWWRDHFFEADVQRTMLARFGDLLTADDHIARAETLLYGQQGPAAHDMLALLPPGQQALAEAKMALREDRSNASELVARVPPELSNDPGLAVERARYFKQRNLESVGLTLVASFPSRVPNDEAADRIWTLRRQLINAALKSGDYRAAYAAATNTGMTSGVDFTESEFYAGWLALDKLHDPSTADAHFANIQRVGSSPITQSRALYWRGRAAETMGADEAAKAFYRDAARFYTSFYGLLAAEKAGVTEISLGHDPAIDPSDRERFQGRELVRAARILGDLGDRELFRAFVLDTAETLPSAEEYALLVDMARGYGDQDLGMRVVRSGAQHGFILPDRGYPLHSISATPDAAEPAIVYGITRQESGFDPRVRSGAGARGMMQLMPETARVVARHIGESYQPGLLDDADYNMRLGASYLGQLINSFSGSYVMATAAYNAGPGRPADWAGYCGDPRGGTVDPVDFIECIPFSETRNYVMRVLESTEVYRARLGGGSAPITLSADLKRGGYVYGGGAITAIASGVNPQVGADGGGSQR